MSDKPIAFRELPAELFPFTISMVDQDTGELLQEEIVYGPGMLNITGHNGTRRVMAVADYPKFLAVTLVNGEEILVFKEENG